MHCAYKQSIEPVSLHGKGNNVSFMHVSPDNLNLILMGYTNGDLEIRNLNNLAEVIYTWNQLDQEIK